MQADSAYGSSPLRLAYAQARTILASRDGAGFRFIVTLNNGKTFDVCPLPNDDLEYPEPGHGGIAYWPCEHGENTLIINHGEIAAIEIYEC